MSRLTISLPDKLHNRIASFAMQQDASMSSVINQLIQVGLHYWYENQEKPHQLIEQHCQQLIIQMNALIKNMSAELLKFSPEDFEQLQQATTRKYKELVNK